MVIAAIQKSAINPVRDDIILKAIKKRIRKYQSSTSLNPFREDIFVATKKQNIISPLWDDISNFLIKQS